MSLRSFLALSLVVAGHGCVATITPASAVTHGNESADAAVVTTMPSSCEPVGETYGRTPETPLEWGTMASALGGRFMGRISCAGGARVQLQRVGSLGITPAPSDSPRCGVFGAIGGSDIIDEWQARCPGEPVQTWYTNAYRCGSECPPAGFSLVPEEMADALVEVEHSLEQHDNTSAEQSARHALSLSPDDEEANKWMGTVLFVAGRPLEARPYFEAALRAHPGHPYHRLHLAMIAQDQDYARYADIVSDLRSELSDDHALHWELVCREAHALRREPERRADAIAGAEQACASGFGACCDFDPTPPS